MTSYFLDTSFIIDYLRGKEFAISTINSLKGDLASSYICLAFLYEGLYRIGQRQKQEEGVLTFFGSLDTLYGIGMEIAQKFGALRAALKQKGEVIEDIDLFIAATCLVYNLTLITNNKKHFSRISQLQLY